METTPAVAPAPQKASDSRTTPRDFFLWLGIIIALYGSITSLLALLFQYINFAYPDPITGGGDPYASSTHVAMATVIVLVPTTLVLFHVVRNICEKDPTRLTTWVRRWALVLTIFIASATMLIDLITLITTFLGGEVTMRFILKALVVLLSAGGIFLHFLADIKGYWTADRRNANNVGYAFGILALLTVIAGFVVIGSPAQVRAHKLDQQKVNDLENIQSQVLSYWQLKRELPKSLNELSNPLSGYTVPLDEQTGLPYEYGVGDSNVNFTLCADFNIDNYTAPSNIGPYGYGTVGDQNFTHGKGHTCFSRSIDESRYPQKANVPL